MSINFDKKVLGANSTNGNDDSRYPLLLSIIVPIYRVEKYVERCLRSLEDQDLPKDQYEVIAVDDGTPDRSAEIAEQLAKKYGNIRVIHKENGGLSSARNVGMSLAQGRYIMFVDSDDFLEPKVIGKVLDIAERTQAELCFYNNQSYPGKHQMGHQPFEVGTVYTGEYAILHGMVINSAWRNIYLREFMNSTGILFKEGILHEDIEFNYRLYPLVQRMVFTDLMVYNYNLVGESIMRTNNPHKMEKRIIDNIIGKRSILDFQQTHPVSLALQNHINHLVTSEMLAILGKFLHRDYRHQLLPGALDRILNMMTTQCLYPIPGYLHMTWKHRLALPVFNCRWLLKLIYSIG